MRNPIHYVVIPCRVMHQQPAWKCSLLAGESMTISAQQGIFWRPPPLSPSLRSPLRTALCRLLPCVSRSPPRRRAGNAVSPVFLAGVSHDATVAWKPPPADTVTAPDTASRAFFSLLLTRWPRRTGASEEEESFPDRMASSKPRKRSWWRGADGFPGWGNTASRSGKFAEFSPDTRFRQKVPRRGCSWNMGSLGHGSGKQNQPTKTLTPCTN